MAEIEEFCPAKVNLFLAVTGRRQDGFHELVSLMAPIDLGDCLRIRLLGRKDADRFRCSDPALPQGPENLVLRALAAFRQRQPVRQGVWIELEKRLRAGAGLGGGSSDAAGLLLGLNRLLGEPLGPEELHGIAAGIGSDCPFFLHRQPAVARGRGERLELLSEPVRARLRGLSLLLVKPSFGVATAWAYGALARVPEEYCPAARAEERLALWLEGQAPPADLLFNNLEGPVFRKYVALPALKRRLEEQGRLPVLMSGSGSTLFALTDGGAENARGEGKEEAARAAARDALGESGWICKASLL